MLRFYIRAHACMWSTSAKLGQHSWTTRDFHDLAYIIERLLRRNIPTRESLCPVPWRQGLVAQTLRLPSVSTSV